MASCRKCGQDALDWKYFPDNALVRARCRACGYTCFEVVDSTEWQAMEKQREKSNPPEVAA